MVCTKFKTTNNWLKKNRDIKSFLNKPASENYLWRMFQDGASRLERIMEPKQIGRLLAADILAQVTTDVFDVEWVYAGLRSDDGTDVDLTVKAIAKVSNPRVFLLEYGLERLKTTDAVSIPLLENMLIQSCKQPVADEIVTITYDALKNQDALPVSWWHKKLSGWINLPWLELKEVKSVCYESAAADKEAQIKQRRKLQELEAAEQAQQHERELTFKQQQDGFELAKKEIENSKTFTEMQQQMQLEELEQKRQQQSLQYQLDMEAAKLKANKERAIIEVEIEQLRNNAASAEELRQQAQEAEQRNKEMLESLKDAMKQLAEMASVTKAAVQEKIGTTERIGVSASGVSTRTMELLGNTASPAYLAQVLRERATAAANSVLMKKLELRTRDIGTKKVDALAINSTLQFEFMAQQSGYATILNIGTSGRVWLHSPNAYVGIEQAKVSAGEKHQIPGQLLPGQDLMRNGLDYIEVGPPGWEELAVIITPEPIISESDIYSSTPQNPFVLMSKERIETLLDQLSYLSEDSWCTGVLSFLVEGV